MKKVAIIIVTWNGMKWIDKCLSSINQSNYPVTTFLVDNNSTDGTPNHIEKGFPNVRLIHSQKNLGFGKANNVAIQQAFKEKFDYFFLLNQDAYIKEDTVERLLEVAATDEYAIVSPVHLNGNGSKVDPYFREFVLGKCQDYLDQSVVGVSKRIFDSAFIPAAAWFLPSRTIQEIGLFDSLFYHYGEDDNYCQRCNYHHRKIVFTLDAIVLHDRIATVGNQKMYNYKLFYRHLLQDAANIQYSKGYIFQKMGRQFYDEIGLWFMYLFTGKWKMLHNFVEDYVKLLCHLPQICKSRKRNKALYGLKSSF